MNTKDLLQRLEESHVWQSKAIIELRELIKNEDKFTSQAILELKNDVLQKVQLIITEMEILAFELEG